MAEIEPPSPTSWDIFYPLPPKIFNCLHLWTSRSCPFPLHPSQICSFHIFFPKQCRSSNFEREEREKLSVHRLSRGSMKGAGDDSVWDFGYSSDFINPKQCRQLSELSEFSSLSNRKMNDQRNIDSKIMSDIWWYRPDLSEFVRIIETQSFPKLEELAFSFFPLSLWVEVGRLVNFGEWEAVKPVSDPFWKHTT